MKTGWTVSILDSHAKDKTYKFVGGDRDKAETKRAEYQSRYNAIEMGRFQVELDAQYAEFHKEGVSEIRCSIPEDSLDGVKRILSEFDLLIQQKGSNVVMEFPTRDLEAVKGLLQEQGIS